MNRLLYFSILVFLILLLSVSQDVAVVHLDDDIRYGVQNIWGDNLNRTIIFITDIGAEFSVFVSLILVIIYFVRRKQSIYIRFYFTGLFGSIVLYEIIKELIGRPRPHTMLISELAKSFPSGHATIATVISWFVYLTIVPQISSKYRGLLVAICLLYPALMSFTRVYLNVHYLSDVMAGIALGTAWMLFLSKFYLNHETQISAT